MSSKLLHVGLGIVTSVGGFLEIGSITTAAQGGALFRFQLLWTIVLGGVCVAFLVEQSGRLAAVSGRSIPDAIRERFGFPYYFTLLAVIALVTLIVLGAELAGVCIALEFATGVTYRMWAVPVTFATWLLLWRGNFNLIEQGVSFLGLVAVAFVVAAYELAPDWGDVAKGLLPTLPQSDSTRYWFVAVSILGASVSPYLMFFYSSGAVEEKWSKDWINANRAIAWLGMGFGTVMSVGVLIVAALVLAPRGIELDDYTKLPMLLTQVFGHWGFVLIVAILAITCLGAALEITLAIAYMFAQGFGWNWTEDHPPRDEARFAVTYTIVLFAGMLIVLTGIDPLKLTNVSMALTAATLPIAIVPFLFVMNDKRFIDEYPNGRVSNALVLFSVLLACVLAIVSLPLEIFGGG